MQPGEDCGPPDGYVLKHTQEQQVRATKGSGDAGERPGAGFNRLCNPALRLLHLAVTVVSLRIHLVSRSQSLSPVWDRLKGTSIFSSDLLRCVFKLQIRFLG